MDFKETFLKEYNCNTLFEFIDNCLDFDLSIDILQKYFNLQKENEQLKQDNYILTATIQEDIVKENQLKQEISDLETTIATLKGQNAGLYGQIVCLKQKLENINKKKQDLIGFIEYKNNSALYGYLMFKKFINEILEKLKGEDE